MSLHFYLVISKLPRAPGGASAGKFDFPEKALRPDFASEEQWDLLCSSATPVRKAAGIARSPSTSEETSC